MPMLRGIQRANAYLYWVYIKIGPSDGLGEWRGYCVLGAVQCLFLLLVLTVLKFDYAGRRYAVACIAALGFGIWNYFSLLKNDRWKHYVQEFERIPRGRRWLYDGLVIVASLAALPLIAVVSRS